MNKIFHICVLEYCSVLCTVICILTVLTVTPYSSDTFHKSLYYILCMK